LFFFLSRLTEGKKTKKADNTVYTIKGEKHGKAVSANSLAALLRQPSAGTDVCGIKRWWFSAAAAGMIRGCFCWSAKV
jgi:hypothetical protein